MGTHPIFESDFDCLTELLNRQKRLVTRRRERCAVTCPTVKVVLASTARVVTVVVAVSPVVNIITASTLTSTIPDTSERSNEAISPHQEPGLLQLDQLGQDLVLGARRGPQGGGQEHCH